MPWGKTPAGPAEPRPPRRFEVALARRVWERDIPLLGICRGAQVLNVARGGMLIEDLATAGASRVHLIERATFNLHEVDPNSGSRAERIYTQSSSC